MKFIAAGDAIIQRRIQSDFKGYGELAPYINSADARFFNLETTLNREGECPGSQYSGGTYLRIEPEVLDDLMKFGFNMTSFLLLPACQSDPSCSPPMYAPHSGQ